MRAIWKGFGFLAAALGVAAWIGGATAFAVALINTAGLSPDTPMGAGRMGLVIAGVTIALVGSIILLRVTHSVIWFVVCLACGGLACLAGAGIDPSHFAQVAPLGSLVTLAAFVAPAIVLMFSRRMIPFLITIGIFGLIAVAGSAAFLASGPKLAQAPAPSAAPGVQAPATATDPLFDEAQIEAEAEKRLWRERSEEGPSVAAPGQTFTESQAEAAAARWAADMARMRAQVRAEREAYRKVSPFDPNLDEITVSAYNRSGEIAEQEAAAAAANATPAEFHAAALKFNKPAEMQLATPAVVDAIIAAPGAETPLTLGDVGETVSREVQITRKVRVELVSDDFDITPLHKVETVVIAPGTAGHWSWRVTPRQEGADRKMLLQVFGVFDFRGETVGEVLLKTYEEKILVKVTPMKRVEMFSQSLVAAWQPIAGLLGAIGGIWVFVQRIFAALRKKPAAA